MNLVLRGAAVAKALERAAGQVGGRRGAARGADGHGGEGAVDADADADIHVHVRVHVHVDVHVQRGDVDGGVGSERGGAAEGRELVVGPLALEEHLDGYARASVRDWTWLGGGGGDHSVIHVWRQKLSN